MYATRVMTSRDGPEPASPASEPVVRNPYRVLGLSGDATWPEIRAAAARILDEPEPERHATAWDLPWLGAVPRSPAEVERALARLGDPHTRLRSRVFWFHERVAESAVYELQPSTIRNALEGWSSTALEVARHDAAVVALIAAITLDPDVRSSALWQRALREWNEALDLEAYWMDVLRVEMEGGFESPASLAEVRDLRDRASEMVSEPLLVYAREAVIAEEIPRAARTLAVLREVLSREAFTARCGDLAEHVWGSFDADWTPRPVVAPDEPAPEPVRDDEPLVHTQNPGLWDLDDEAEAEDLSAARDLLPEEPAPAPERDDAGPTPEEAAPEPAIEARAPEPDSEPATPEPDSELPPPEPPTVEPRVAEAPERDAAEPSPRAAPLRSPDAEEADGTRPPRPDPAPRPRDRRARRRVRPAVAAAAVAAAVLASVFLPRFRPETEAGAAPADRVLRVDIENRMDMIDGLLAEALIDRHRSSVEIDVLEESLDGYQTLVDDYERRMARRLPADRTAYRRVVGLRDEAKAELDRAVEGRAGIEARIGRLRDLAAGLVEEWNAASVPAGAASDREPSP